MCQDYRHVNKHLATDIYPLPRLEELVDQAAGHNFYATLDMREAYFQIILDENSRDLTAFSDGELYTDSGDSLLDSVAPQPYSPVTWLTYYQVG